MQNARLMRIWLISYDIADAKRRYRVARILPVRLAKIINAEDKLAYWPICGQGAIGG